MRHPKIRGNRKRRVSINGPQIRAIQEIADGGWIDYNRRDQIREHMEAIVDAYVQRDQVVELAEGIKE